MKPTHWFTIAAALAGCAVAAGLYIVRESGQSGSASQTVDGAKSAPQRSARRSAVSPVIGEISRSNRSAARADAAERAASTPLRISGRPPQGAQAVVSEAEWFARAEKVEREANHEVRRLAQALDLTPAQQAGIFGVVARNSELWLPGMQVGGGATTGKIDQGEGTPSEADQVMAYLDADQQQTLIQEEMDRRAWWEEVLPQLLPPDLPVATEPAEEIKPFDGAETLME